MSEHFPPKERGIALGIYTVGAMIGATLAPPLIAGIALHFGWRAAFIVTGATGLVWLVVWLNLYPRNAPEPKEEQISEGALWGRILRDRSVWLLAGARAVADPVWYFYLFWFPKYLTDIYGLTLIAVASMAWIVYLAADLGSIGGGFFSSRLIARGVAPATSRIIVMGAARWWRRSARSRPAIRPCRSCSRSPLPSPLPIFCSRSTSAR
ncbi:MFS transporter [Sphingobium scionense]